MKKIFLAFLTALLIGGCGFPFPPFNLTPTANIPTDAPTATAPATDTVQPTATSAPATETFTPTLELTITPSPQENLTTTPATATSEPIIPSATMTAISFEATRTPTPGVLTYGTLPPAVPFNTVVLVNKSKEQVYISLQQQDGKEAILEYPVKGKVYVDAPIGQYIYVAWVGGRKMTGRCRVNAFSTLYITFFKDRIVVENQ